MSGRGEWKRSRKKYQFEKEDQFWQSNQIRKSADLSSPLPSHLLLSYSHPFCVISCLSIPEISSRFSLSLSTFRISASIFLLSTHYSLPVPGQLPSFVFLSIQGNRVMVRPKRRLGRLGRVEGIWSQAMKGVTDDRNEHQQSVKKRSKWREELLHRVPHNCYKKVPSLCYVCKIHYAPVKRDVTKQNTEIDEGFVMANKRESGLL